MSNYVYMTLLSSDDYFISVLILNKKLKEVQSKYPLVVCITDNIINENIIDILNAESIEYKIISKIDYPQQTLDIITKESYMNTASKLQIFSFKEYDKVCYLDSDVLILQNIDDVFDYPNGAMVYYPEYGMGISSFFIFQPKYHKENLYLILLEQTNYLDGSLLGHIFFSAKENPNFQIPKCYNTDDIKFIESQYRSIHFLKRIKPFSIKKEDRKRFNVESYNIYFEEMDYFQNKYDYLK